MQNASAWRSEAAEALAPGALAPARYTARDLAAMLWRERGRGVCRVVEGSCQGGGQRLLGKEKNHVLEDDDHISGVCFDEDSFANVTQSPPPKRKFLIRIL